MVANVDGNITWNGAQNVQTCDPHVPLQELRKKSGDGFYVTLHLNGTLTWERWV